MPETPVGLVEPGTDDATCEICNRQATLYALDEQSWQRFACVDHLAPIVVKILTIGPRSTP